MSTPYVTFPGTAGNYVSTADVNLLDSDTAHFHQALSALWSAGALSTTHVLFGDNSLKVTGGVDTILTPAVDSAIFSCYVYSVAGANFTVVSAGGGGSLTAVPAATWTQITGTVGDGTYTVTCSAATDYWVDKACLRAGADATFVPSLRIVGPKATIAAKASVDVTARGGYLFQPPTGANLTLDYLATTGKLRAVWKDATPATRFKDSSVAPTWANTPEVAVVIDTDADTQTFYENGSQLGTVGGTVGLGFSGPGVSTVWVGNNADAFFAKGDVFWVELRDGGLTGPVVARFDAADVAKATL